VQLPQLAAAAAAPPAASEPRRHRVLGPACADVHWDTETRADVLAFWTAEGVLLPEADIESHQLEQQQRTRQKVLRWGGKHKRHRSVAFLQDYMSRMRAAAAELAYDGNAAQLALAKADIIQDNKDPAGVIGRLRATEEALAAHGLKAVSRIHLTALASKSAGALMDDRLPRLMAALAQLPVSVDPVLIVQRAPTLLALHDIEGVLQRRVAALQRLHPQLDVGKVLRGAPSLLMRDEAKVACNWAALQAAAGLDSDGIRALVESSPAFLFRSTGPATWRLQQARTYERKRQAAKSPAPANSQEVQDPVEMRLSAISAVIRAASWRLWRLPYLASVSAFNCSVRTWVDMTPEEFEVRHGPGYSAWLLENPMPPEAFTNRGT